MNVPGALAVVNIGQLVTLAGPPRPRFGRELSELAIVEDGALIIEDGSITSAGPCANSGQKFLDRRCSSTRRAAA